MERKLELEILAQPDDSSCGPTCLHAVYRYYGETIPLLQVIRETGMLETGGTLAVQLGIHALRRGYSAEINTYNLAVFDPSWFQTNTDLAAKLRAQAAVKSDPRLQHATNAYLEFLALGGVIRMEELSTTLLRGHLAAGRPILTGLSATYLYECPREIGETVLHYDDIHGQPTGHFVVLCGYAPTDRHDPGRRSPPGQSRLRRALLRGRRRAGTRRHLPGRAHLRRQSPDRGSAPHREDRVVKRLVVVENVARWPFELEGAEVVSARDYLTEARYAEMRSAIVFNVCRAYRYQSLGYYVSLLATARRHRPLPSVETLQDLRMSSVLRMVAEDLEDEMQRALSHLRGDRFELSVYFGRNLAKRYDRLARALFDQFPAPFLRATFVYEDRWKMQSIRPIATAEIPGEPQRIRDRAGERLLRAPAAPARAPHLSLRHGDPVRTGWTHVALGPGGNPQLHPRRARARDRCGGDRSQRPPDSRRVRRAVHPRNHRRQPPHLPLRAAGRRGGPGGHRRSESIVRCTNKVYLAELFARTRHRPAPKRSIVHRDERRPVAEVSVSPAS